MKAQETTKDDEEADEKLEYGIRRCTPTWLQCCTNPKAMIFWLSWFGTVQGFVVNGINNTNVSTLERRYRLPSYEAGFISSAYDIAAGILIVPVTYFGAHAHQPRLLAFAALIMSMGSFVMALPQFTVGLYELGQTVPNTCDVSDNSTSCDDHSSGLSSYLYVFVLGQFLHGVGGTILYTLGVVFIDSNVRPQSAPIYQGIFYAFAALGPAIGFVVGGMCLNIYVDFYRIEKVDITVNDPRWVGAWWIGFASSSALLITVFLGIAPYPRELPSARRAQSERKSETHSDGSEQVAQKEGFGRSIKDFPVALKILVCNPTNMLVTMAGVTEGLIISGFTTFMPKYLQSQFGLTAGRAALLGGLMAVPGAAGGEFLGGAVARCFKLRVRGMLRLCVVLCCMGPLLAIVLLFFKCDSAKIAGIHVKYLNKNETFGDSSPVLSSACNQHCSCSTASFDPVCGVDGVQYFSPCYAGCNSTVTATSGKTYNNCSCIISPEEHNSTLFDTHPESGTCAAPCTVINIFLPFFFLVILTTFMIQVPGLMISLRCIPESQRAFGFGIKWLFIRFLGTVPGPILFGTVFDSTCTVWQEKCSSRGSCWIYDKEKLSIYVFIVVLIFKLLSALFFFLAHCCYKPPRADNIEIRETVYNINTDNRLETSAKQGGLEGTGYVPYVATKSKSEDTIASTVL